MLNFSPEEVVIGVMASFTYVTWMVIMPPSTSPSNPLPSGSDRVLLPEGGARPRQEEQDQQGGGEGRL